MGDQVVVTTQKATGEEWLQGLWPQIVPNHSPATASASQARAIFQ